MRPGSRPALALAAVLVCAILAPATAAAAPDRDPRIVGGERITIADAPWQVALAFNPDSDPNPASERQFCGGALLSPTVVITAAHCIFDDDFGFSEAEQFSVIGGRTDLDSDEGAEVGVAEYRVVLGADGEPLYNDGSSGQASWDFALLRLESELPGTPIQISGEDETPLWASGQTLLASGWGTIRKSGSGRPRGLKAVSLTAFADPTCLDTYPPPDGFNAEIMFCTSAIGGDTCKGDSGGPIVAFGAGGAVRLVGVTSWGGDGWSTPCAGAAGVYTRIGTEPMRTQVRALAQELGAGDPIGSGAVPAQAAPPLTAAEALQLTYNEARGRCENNLRCRTFRAIGCSADGAGFICRASNRIRRRDRNVTCAWWVSWSGSAIDGPAHSATKPECRRHG